jgi:hypothetical protein
LYRATDELRRFRERGYLVVRGALDAGQVERARAAVGRNLPAERQPARSYTLAHWHDQAAGAMLDRRTGTKFSKFSTHVCTQL